eukprot:GHVU01232273.1.p2 GENE.GHVU01232273.1~~GHVU01232273.1.p2  ORF type:complete len:121 (+),score=8.63 GHVU01232273.1:235-597(+)
MIRPMFHISRRHLSIATTATRQAASASRIPLIQFRHGGGRALPASPAPAPASSRSGEGMTTTRYADISELPSRFKARELSEEEITAINCGGLLGGHLPLGSSQGFWASKLEYVRGGRKKL